MPEDVRLRVEGIRRRIAENEEMRPEPPLSEAQLQSYERENGVSLPEDYRLFLQIIGNGVSGDNIYGICPLDTWEEDAQGNRMGGDVRKPFPLTEYVDYEVDGFPEEEDEDNNPLNGILFVLNAGDAFSWMLIITGPERGNMWLDNEHGYWPSSPRVGFLDWCEQWVERGWDDGLEDMVASGQEEN